MSVPTPEINSEDDLSVESGIFVDMFENDNEEHGIHAESPVPSHVSINASPPSPASSITDDESHMNPLAIVPSPMPIAASPVPSVGPAEVVASPVPAIPSPRSSVRSLQVLDAPEPNPLIQLIDRLSLVLRREIPMQDVARALTNLERRVTALSAAHRREIELSEVIASSAPAISSPRSSVRSPEEADAPEPNRLIQIFNALSQAQRRKVLRQDVARALNDLERRVTALSAAHRREIELSEIIASSAQAIPRHRSPSPVPSRESPVAAEPNRLVQLINLLSLAQRREVQMQDIRRAITNLDRRVIALSAAHRRELELSEGIRSSEVQRQSEAIAPIDLGRRFTSSDRQLSQSDSHISSIEPTPTANPPQVTFYNYLGKCCVETCVRPIVAVVNCAMSMLCKPS